MAQGASNIRNIRQDRFITGTGKYNHYFASTGSIEIVDS